MISQSSKLADIYYFAQAYIVEHGYFDELQWQRSADFADVTESIFLSEAAWVVLASGMSESIVRKVFGSIGDAFCGWRSASAIAAMPSICIEKALAYFNHKGKVEAIATIACMVDETGFEKARQEILRDGVRSLMKYPYLGPATAYHLAKNLGVDVVKPDRHLIRMADAAGYPNPESMCSCISQEVGERLGVIDLVLWRYATLRRDYLSLFT